MCDDAKQHEQLAIAALAMIPPCQAIRASVTLALTVNEVDDIEAKEDELDFGGPRFSQELLHCLVQALDPFNHAMTDEQLAKAADEAAAAGMPGHFRSRAEMVESARNGVKRMLRACAMALAVFDEDDVTPPEHLMQAAATYPEGGLEEIRIAYDAWRKHHHDHHVDPLFSEDGTEIIGEQLSLDMLGELDDLPVLDDEPDYSF